MSGQKCTIPDCINCAEGDTNPPLCSLHLDLDILVEFTVSRKEEPTLATIQNHFLAARSASSFWTLTHGQIAVELPAVLEARGLPVPVGEQKETGAPTPVSSGRLPTAK
jgi:hypothetical protein